MPIVSNSQKTLIKIKIEAFGSYNRTVYLSLKQAEQ